MVSEIADGAATNASICVNLAFGTVQPPLNVASKFKTRFHINLVLQSVRIHNSQNTDRLAKTGQTTVELTLQLT